MARWRVRTLAAISVDHERVRLHGRSRVVQRVRILRRLALQLALVRQRPRSAVTEKSARQTIYFLAYLFFVRIQVRKQRLRNKFCDLENLRIRTHQDIARANHKPYLLIMKSKTAFATN